MSRSLSLHIIVSLSFQGLYCGFQYLLKIFLISFPLIGLSETLSWQSPFSFLPPSEFFFLAPLLLFSFPAPQALFLFLLFFPELTFLFFIAFRSFPFLFLLCFPILVSTLISKLQIFFISLHALQSLLLSFLLSSFKSPPFLSFSPHLFFAFPPV